MKKRCISQEICLRLKISVFSGSVIFFKEFLFKIKNAGAMEKVFFSRLLLSFDFSKVGEICARILPATCNTHINRCINTAFGEDLLCVTHATWRAYHHLAHLGKKGYLPPVADLKLYTRLDPLRIPPKYEEISCFDTEFVAFTVFFKFFFSLSSESKCKI